MNKKGMETSTVIGLIILVIVIAIVIGILYYQGKILAASSNAEAIKVWVTTLTATKGTEVVAQAVPPVIDLEAPLEIEKRGQLIWSGAEPPKAYKEIANSMVDCWNAFDRGKSDFLNNVERKVFCFPCRAVVFSDDLKKENVDMVGFNRYLNQQHVGGKDSPTYLQYLANDKSYVLDDEDLADDRIKTDKDLYIFFFAASGKEWTKLGWLSLYSLVDTAAFGLPSLIVGSPDEVFSISEDNQVLYKPTNLDAPSVVTPGGETGMDNLVKATGEGGVIILREPIAEAITKRIAADAASSSVRIEPGVGQVVEFTSRAPVSKVGKVVGKGVVKTLGSKLFVPIALSVVAYDVGSGIYKIVFDQKDFVATVTLAEADTITKKCSEL